jgi:hypothetical protein
VTEKLNPCPCCGSAKVKVDVYHEGNRLVPRAECMSCGININGPSSVEVVEAWNKFTGGNSAPDAQMHMEARDWIDRVARECLEMYVQLHGLQGIRAVDSARSQLFTLNEMSNRLLEQWARKGAGR